MSSNLYKTYSSKHHHWVALRRSVLVCHLCALLCPEGTIGVILQSMVQQKVCLNLMLPLAVLNNLLHKLMLLCRKTFREKYVMSHDIVTKKKIVWQEQCDWARRSVLRSLTVKENWQVTLKPGQSQLTGIKLRVRHWLMARIQVVRVVVSSSACVWLTSSLLLYNQT